MQPPSILSLVMHESFPHVSSSLYNFPCKIFLDLFFLAPFDTIYDGKILHLKLLEVILNFKTPLKIFFLHVNVLILKLPRTEIKIKEIQTLKEIPRN